MDRSIVTDGGFLTMCLRFGTKADVSTTSKRVGKVREALRVRALKSKV